MVQPSATTSVVLREDLNENHARAFNFGFSNSPFQEGATFRGYYAGYYTNVEYFDWESRTMKKISGDGMHLLVLTPAGGKPEEWLSVTSSSGRTEAYPSLKGCLNYGLTRLISVNRVGYKLILNENWKSGDFAKGLCSTKNRPDVIDAALLPRSLQDLAANPQYAVPRELFSGLGLTTTLLKEVGLSSLSVDATGKVTLQQKAVNPSRLDYELWIQNKIKTSNKMEDGHPYIELMFKYTKDQYCEWRNHELQDPHAIGYFELLP